MEQMMNNSEIGKIAQEVSKSLNIEELNSGNSNLGNLIFKDPLPIDSMAFNIGFIGSSHFPNNK